MKAASRAGAHASDASDASDASGAPIVLAAGQRPEQMESMMQTWRQLPEPEREVFEASGPRLPRPETMGMDVLLHITLSLTHGRLT